MILSVWTVGHSTRPISDFIEVLAGYRIELVADVRRFPGSRSQPQFNGPALETSLHIAGIAYISLPALGGRRKLLSSTTSTGWRHPAFRAYAQHMESEEFAGGLFELMMVAAGLRTAVMCAEVLWWRCLSARVIHIVDARTASAHRLSPPARLVGGALSYLPKRSS